MSSESAPACQMRLLENCLVRGCAGPHQPRYLLCAAWRKSGQHFSVGSGLVGESECDACWQSPLEEASRIAIKAMVVIWNNIALTGISYLSISRDLYERLQQGWILHAVFYRGFRTHPRQKSRSRDRRRPGSQEMHLVVEVVLQALLKIEALSGSDLRGCESDLALRLVVVAPSPAMRALNF